LPKTFFHLEVGEMIIDEILAWVKNEEEQLTKVNWGTKDNV
jgi:hypothetical protein